MKEIECSEWVEGNYIKAQDLKKDDVIKLRSKLYIVTWTHEYDNAVYDIHIQDIYDGYKDYCIGGYKDRCPGKQMFMPSIDINDIQTAHAYEDLCSKRAAYLTKKGIKANKGKAMRLDILKNFKDIANDMGIIYSGIKYTEYVMPFKSIYAVPANLWETHII
jgi:hypothetical protein